MGAVGETGGARRGDDAEDHAPKPGGEDRKHPAGDRQDAPNTERRDDDAGAVEVEDVNSANDEGAG